MSYGIPVEDESERRYEAVFNTGISLGEYPLVIKVSASSDNLASALVDSEFQQFVDMVLANTSYTFTATRKKTFTEAITETP